MNRLPEHPSCVCMSHVYYAWPHAPACLSRVCTGSILSDPTHIQFWVLRCEQQKPLVAHSNTCIQYTHRHSAGLWTGDTQTLLTTLRQAEGATHKHPYANPATKREHYHKQALNSSAQRKLRATASRTATFARGLRAYPACLDPASRQLAAERFLKVCATKVCVYVS